MRDQLFFVAGQRVGIKKFNVRGERIRKVSRKLISTAFVRYFIQYVSTLNGVSLSVIVKFIHGLVDLRVKRITHRTCRVHPTPKEE